jgi:2-methylcitrate dehydratase PrpD
LDHKGQAGTLASAITAGVALGLDAAQMGHALALSADMACGTEQYVYDSGLCDTKDLLAGTAARNGIIAAKMAHFGFRGPPGALDGPYGYYHAFGGGYDPAYLDGIGTRFALAETGFKPHAGCRFVHACVDAVQELVRTSGKPALDEIASIEVGSYTDAITPDFRVDPNPPNQGLAGFSLPAAASIALVRGSFYADDIATYNDPQIARLRPLVKVRLDPEMEAAYPKRNGCVVRLTMTDGRQLVGRVDDAKGEPENMLTDQEFQAKFRRLVGNLLPPRQADEIIALAAGLEQLTDAGELVRRTAVRGA